MSYIVLIFLLLQACGNTADKNIPSSVAKAEENKVAILATDLEVPWGMDQLPDGRLLFTERNGDISLLDMQTQQKTKIAKRDIVDRAEGGLLGLAVDPDFSNSYFIFLYETVESGNRIVRLKMENSTLNDEVILVDSIPKKQFHDGGIICFGPDGFLYASTGDAREPECAQDLKSYSGKILRMDKNGNAPADNPFQNLIYSYGHRNVQGLCWDENGVMYASEHGPSGELNGWCCHDELNKIEKGGNYGWPFVIGDTKKEGTILPIAQSGDDTWAPGGIIFLDNKIYMTCLKGERINVFSISPQNTVQAQEKLFADTYGRLRNIIIAKDGSIIFCSSNKDGRGNPDKEDDKIYRVSR